MYRAAFLFVLPLLTTATAFAQSAPPDSPALQALVSEIRQLRRDLYTTTAATQRVQIALFRLQIQATAVARATSRLDELRSRISQSQSHHAEIATRMQQFEEKQRGTQDPNELKAVSDILPQLKADLDREAGEEQRLQAIEAEAASQFKAEEAKLNELQDQLDKLDKFLTDFGAK
jgi:chromosome segregation ATPase